MHKAATSWKQGGGQCGQTLSTWEDAQGALAGGEELSERVSVTWPGLRESDGILRAEKNSLSLYPPLSPRRWGWRVSSEALQPL